MNNSSVECLGLKFDFNDSHHFNDKQTELFESYHDIINTLCDIGLDIKDEGCNMSVHRSYKGAIVLEVNAGINNDFYNTNINAPRPGEIGSIRMGRYNEMNFSKLNDTLNRMIKYMNNEGYIKYKITGICDHYKMRKIEWSDLFPYNRTEFPIYGIQIEFFI